MYEKVFLGLILGLLLCASCATRPATNVELEHQRNVADAQATIDGLADRIDRYDDIIRRSLNKLETVQRRAATLDGTISQLTDLFEQYDRTVDEMVREFRALQNAITDGD